MKDIPASQGFDITPDNMDEGDNITWLEAGNYEVMEVNEQEVILSKAPSPDIKLVRAAIKLYRQKISSDYYAI